MGVPPPSRYGMEGTEHPLSVLSKSHSTLSTVQANKTVRNYDDITASSSSPSKVCEPRRGVDCNPGVFVHLRVFEAPNRADLHRTGRPKLKRQDTPANHGDCPRVRKGRVKGVESTGRGADVGAPGCAVQRNAYGRCRL